MIRSCRLADQLQTVRPLHRRSPTCDRLIMVEYDEIVQDLENHVGKVLNWGLFGNDVIYFRLQFYFFYAFFES